MRLDPEIKRQVEAVLKSPVPPPTDPEFDELLLRLRKENPQLADLLESAVLFDDLPTPEEETQRAVARRSWLLTLKHRLLDRYDELTGEWVPSRPKQIAVGFAGLIAAATLWFILSTRNTAPAQGGLPVPVPTATTAKPEPAPPASANSEAAAAGGSAASANGEATAATTQSQSPQDIATPPPPGGYTEVPPPPSGYPTTPPPSGYSTTTGAEQTPPPQPLTLYVANAGGATQAASSGQQASSATPPAPLSIATATTTQSQGGPLTLTRPQAPSAPASSGRPLTGTVAEDVAAAIQNQPVSSNRSSDGALTLKKETQSTFTVRAVEGQGGRGGSFYLVGGPNPAQADTAQPPAQQTAPGAALPVFPGAPVAPPAPAPGPLAANAASLYPLGTRLKGRLGIGVLIAEGVPGPVAVDAEDGSTWVGEVTLDETRRLKGKLTKAIKDGREYTVSATLLDAEGTLGVAARVREEAPSIAADLIRGSLRGVSDYVTAASQAKSVTVLPGGGVAQSSQTPPLELFMAGSLANLFALQQDKKAVVRVAQAEKGTEVVILVVPSQEPATR